MADSRRFSRRWDRLSKVCSYATTSLAIWQHDGIGQPSARRSALITVTKGEELIAVLPMDSPPPVPRKHRPATSDYLDPLVDTAVETELGRHPHPD